MGRRFFGVCLAALILAFGCATHAPIEPYAHYAKASQPIVGSYVPDTEIVWIDKDFRPDEKANIRAALDEWSYAMNGYRTYIVVSDAFSMSDTRTLERVAAGEGLLVLRVGEADVPMLAPTGTLAWVDELGDNVVHVVSSRVGTRDLKAIVMHEIGHTLGLPHTQASGTLMSGYYQDQTNCIDHYTAITLAGLRYARAVRWDWRHMRTCNRP